jgi:single-strand DNA-binding protein
MPASRSASSTPSAPTRRPRSSAPSRAETGGQEPPPVNTVVVQGRLSADASRRTLPSGDEVVVLRVVVPRGDGRSDALDVAAWTATLRRRTRTWRSGDIVRIEGSVRRRFWRTPTGPSSRWEIHASAATRLQRVPT